jgi:hypothetical protein
MVGRDKNATKATNATSRDKLTIASYCGFTIFPLSMVLTICVMFVVSTTPLASLFLLLLLSNAPPKA